jgi:4-azaleucine resistance transporter AzlC
MKIQAAKAAFPRTIPVLTGYVFLGLTYGVYMNISGFSFLYPALTALCVYGGSLEFLTVTMLLSPFAPAAAFFIALLIQARHLFYGIAMLDRYKGTGWKKFYLIFAMSDETFSVICSSPVPEGVDRGWFMFFISLFDQMYWVIGAALGGLAGSVLPFPTDGLEFVMTAMFVVILLDQWDKDKSHATELIGLGVSLICLILFGADSFIMPAMGGMLLLLTLLRPALDPEYARKRKEMYQ